MSRLRAHISSKPSLFSSSNFEMGFQSTEEVTRLEPRVSARLKRSNSLPDKLMRVDESKVYDSIEESPRLKLDMRQVKSASESKKKLSLNTEGQVLVKQEILQLEKRLQEQFVVRHTLEKALVCGSSSCDTNQASMPKPATDLIKEIAVLELEVVYLEQYLLSLYRKAFDEQNLCVSPTTDEDQRPKSPRILLPRKLFMDVAAVDTTMGCHTQKARSTSELPRQDKMLEKIGVDFCHSSLSQKSAYTAQSPPSCHSQPLPNEEYTQQAASNIITLAEHLGTRISDHVPETPSSISEEMVKCMASIFCKVADPPSAQNGFSSPNSSSFSMGGFSPSNQCDLWSPGFGRESSFDVRLDNPFNVEGLKEFSGPYSTMVEVPCIYRENQKLSEVELMLQNFRYLICRLQEIDPKKMKHEERLAFWINVHNALVMHAFLAYGIPQNNMKTMFLLLKAAYNIGGHTITADTIQTTILGCRTSRPAQWLRMIVSPKTKFKRGNYLQSHAIEYPEPLVHFALCSGGHSDPALRVYTPKRVLQELEGAKEEYIRATFGIRKDYKILLPKLVDLYSKDAALSNADIAQMIKQSLPDSISKSLRKFEVEKPKRSIEWIPHNFCFRYLISKEIVK